MFLAALWCLAAPLAWAQDEDVDDTIVVYDDLFKRWDGTRWLVKTEVVLPFALRFYALNNSEFDSTAFQVRTVIACDKDWKLSNKRWEVSCKIEDFAMRAAVQTRRDNGKIGDEDRVEEVLSQIDDKLTGASLQLQVREDGRVVDYDLEGIPKARDRDLTMANTLGQVMRRVIVGFDMRLRKWNTMGEGEWVEYSSQLMTLPTLDNTASQGNSVVIHRLRKIDGHLTVETRGRGLLAIPFGDQPATYDGRLASVAVYSYDDGYMTERVWAMYAKATAQNYLAEGGNSQYWHAGRIRQLDPSEKPELGKTARTAFPSNEETGVEPWVSVEDF